MRQSHKIINNIVYIWVFILLISIDCFWAQRFHKFSVMSLIIYKSGKIIHWTGSIQLSIALFILLLIFYEVFDWDLFLCSVLRWLFLIASLRDPSFYFLYFFTFLLISSYQFGLGLLSIIYCIFFSIEYLWAGTY